MKGSNGMTNEQRLEKLAMRLSEQEETISQLKKQLAELTGKANEFGEFDEQEPEKTNPNTREGVMEELLDNFDFQKVADVCQYMGWQIYNEEDGVTVDFLKRDAREKIHRAWEAFDCGEADEEYIVHSGPLKLWWCECDEGIFAELSFIGEIWRVEPVEH